ncbi:4-galactosyl-N-acetylglucosaminide 3-alpha-L-fucosyltransferase FUT6-like [Ciona intestinalis]
MRLCGSVRVNANAALLLLTLATILYIPLHLTLSGQERNDRRVVTPAGYKRILIWGDNLPQFMIDMMMYGFSSDKCGNCKIVKGVDPYTCDAIVFEFNRVNPDAKVFRRRRTDQIYVFFSAESTSSLRTSHKVSMLGFGNLFNLTMSYRTDSDIQTPYSTIHRTLNSLKKKYDKGSPLTIADLQACLLQKTGLAIWIGSNCGFTVGAEKRFKLVKKIKQTLGSRLKTRGLCSDNPREAKFKTTAEFFNEIGRYKFYFAFENSYHCRDYITEKVWENAFLSGTVPVIWGPTKRDAEEVLPPGSFIHVDDFYSTQELAKYLLYLDRNVTAYREYFSWWFLNETGYVEKPVGLCKLCRMLHSNPIIRKTIQYPEVLWYGQENRDCMFIKRT